MALSNRSRLEQLPLELFYDVVNRLDHTSLASFALANRQIRNICIPLLFKCVAFDFFSKGLDAMTELAASKIAPHVKSFKYYTVPYFESPYPLTLDMLRREFPLKIYPADRLSIFRKAKADEPQDTESIHLLRSTSNGYCDILQKGTDFAALAAVLQNLPKLTEFILDVKEAGNPLCPLSLAGQLRPWVPDEQICFERHLEASLQAVHLSQATSSITAFTIKGYFFIHSRRFNKGLTSLMNKVFSAIETLTVCNCRLILEYLIENDVEMPALNKFVLSMKASVRLGALHAFFRKHGQNLRSLAVRCDEVTIGGNVDGQDDYYDWRLAKLQILHHIGQYCSLQQVEWVEEYNFLKFDTDTCIRPLLLREIDYEDIESVYEEELLKSPAGGAVDSDDE